MLFNVSGDDWGLEARPPAYQLGYNIFTHSRSFRPARVASTNRSNTISCLFLICYTNKAG